MVQAIVNGTVIAESNDTKMVEGNHYFPPESIKKEFFSDHTDLTTVCHWKGTANYHNITVGDTTLENAAWTYCEPTSDQAQPIKDYVAFYPNKVEIVTN